MSWAYVAVAAISTVGTAYSSDQSRKAQHSQTDAINKAKADEAAQKAEAEAGANAALISNRKRRRAAGGLLASSDASFGGTVLGSAGAAPAAGVGAGAGRSTLGGI